MLRSIVLVTCALPAASTVQDLEAPARAGRSARVAIAAPDAGTWKGSFSADGPYSGSRLDLSDDGRFERWWSNCTGPRKSAPGSARFEDELLVLRALDADGRLREPPLDVLVPVRVGGRRFLVDQGAIQGFCATVRVLDPRYAGPAKGEERELTDTDLGGTLLRAGDERLPLRGPVELPERYRRIALEGVEVVVREVEPPPRFARGRTVTSIFVRFESGEALHAGLRVWVKGSQPPIPGVHGRVVEFAGGRGRARLVVPNEIAIAPGTMLSTRAPVPH